jgi:hypothetical protein
MITAAALGPLPATPTVPLDAGGDDRSCRAVLAERGMEGQIATRGLPAPIQAGRRWPVERTHAWGNQYGKLGWCTERRRVVVEFWLLLALALIVVGRLIRRAWTDYRWEAARAAAHDRLLAQALSSSSEVLHVTGDVTPEIRGYRQGFSGTPPIVRGEGMRCLATSSSASRSMRSLGTTATRHGVTARSVAIRRPSCNSAISPRMAPGPTSVTGLPSISTRSTPSNSRNSSSPGSPCWTRVRPAWSRRNCGLASMTATDSCRSNADSTAVTTGAESSAPQGVWVPNASRHQVSWSMKPLLATSRPLWS